MIDGVVFFVARVAFPLILPGAGEDALQLVGLLLGGLYFTVGVAVWRTTIGKRALGLYVVRPDGSKVGVGRALARYLSYSLSAAILFVGFLMIAWRRDKRGLHDLICDTYVVRK